MDEVQVLEPEEITNQAETLVSLTNLIQNYISSLGKLKQELTENRQMLDDAFNNDTVYKEKADKAKEVMKERNTLKQQMAKQPALLALAEKIKDLREQIKESQQALSDYLQEYQKLTGATEIEDAEGNINEIRYTAKLVKSRGKS